MKTTRENARLETYKTLVKNLQRLLEKNYDAEKGFKKALEYSHDVNLKNYLKNEALLHGRFANELDKIIHSLNDHPKTDSSFIGAFHRKWMEFTSSFNRKDDKFILNECMRGEKSTLKEYEEKLEKNKFPPEIKEVLKKQYKELQTSLKTSKTIEDSWAT